MKWEGREESGNVRDRRGISPGLAIGGGGGIVVAIIALIFGVDFGGGGGGQQGGPAEEKMAKFSKVVLKDTEVIWEDQFRQIGKKYQAPQMELFTGNTNTGCGAADSGIGPFYCPADSTVYIDLSFFAILDEKLGAPGEFARAYVIAHEVGHHVQRLLGYSARVDDSRRAASKVEANHMSVRLELQADYLAGVWAHHAQKRFNFLESGDIESAMNAASKIGDDHLQKQAKGRVQPDSFTHGTSKQRQRWFMEGYKTGSLKDAAKLFSLRYEEL
jgi:predicted metalloprotease